MESWFSTLPQHGYWIVFASVFLETIGFPVPAAIALMIAGAASARGALQPFLALAGALGTMIIGDTLMFLMGRYTGWWILGLLCRLSLNPESCMMRSADAFHRRGRLLLVFAKFIPGINTMAPPMAGSMNMRAFQFLRFDLAGAALYIGSYFSVGWLFGDALGTITNSYDKFGRILGWMLIAAVSGYLLFRVWMWTKARPLRLVPFVGPSEAAQLVVTEAALIYDVRSHGYYDPHAERIRGSRRLDPNALHQLSDDFPKDKQILLYCTCVREATSARVAQILLDRGVHSAVIKGGLRAWKRAHLPLETVPQDEISSLPLFNP